MKIAIGITGAGGTFFAKKCIEHLCTKNELLVIASDDGADAFKLECGTALYDFLRRKKNVARFNNNDICTLLNGSINPDLMIILPCSAQTAGQIALNLGNTLLPLIADKILREGKKLILGLGETAFSTATLQNLYTLSLMGATVTSLAVPFNNNAATQDFYDDLLNKFLQLCNLEN